MLKNSYSIYVIIILQFFISVIIIVPPTISINLNYPDIEMINSEMISQKIYPDLNFSTFLGGNNVDSGFEASIAIGNDGSCYVIGDVNSSDFPTKNAFDDTFNGGIRSDYGGDVFISKISANGSLLWSTYFGGNESDSGYGVAIGNDNSCYITGETSSIDFPTLNAYDDSYNGGGYYGDAFVAKFDENGSLLWSTFFGGNDDEYSSGIALDNEGYCYITGETDSNDFPILNAYDSIRNSGDAFISKFNPNGSLIWSSYFGGSFSDVGSAIAVGNDGSCFITGLTYSHDFPILNAYFNSISDEYGYDAFLSKFDTNGTLLWSTYLGGNNYDEGESISIADDGCCFVTGFTWSNNFPTLNAYDGSYNYHDSFISKFNSTGSLLWSTYFGGTWNDFGAGIAIDNNNNCYITGSTSSYDDFPILNAYSSFSNGAWDAFLAKFNTNGSLLFSTYLGGESGDSGRGIAIDDNDTCWIIGSTQSSDFPTKNAIDITLDGESDAFIVKFIQKEDEIEPVISNIQHTPTNPSNEDTVTISCSTNDNYTGVEFVTLYYRINSGSWIQENMSYESSTSSYKYNIGIFSYGDKIDYYIYAIDKADNYAINDNSGNYYSLTIIDADNIGPDISYFIRSPAFPTSKDIITITCIVSDESGIKNVTLYYRVNNGTWETLEMTLNSNDDYQATFNDTFDPNDRIDFYIVAVDNSPDPNITIDDNYGLYYNFTIEDLPENPPYGYLAFLAVIPIAAIIGVVLKKNKTKSNRRKIK